MAGQCLRSNQHEPDTTPGGSRRQEGLACSGPWGHEESDTTKRLNTQTREQIYFKNTFYLFMTILCRLMSRVICVVYMKIKENNRCSTKLIAAEI